MRINKFLLLVFSTLLLTGLQSVWLNPVIFGSTVVAQTLNARKTEGDRLFQQGNEQFHNSQFQAALQSWQQALTIYQQTGNQLEIATTMNQLGIAYFTFGKYQNAKQFHEQSLVIARKIGSKKEEVKSLNGLGNALCFLSKYQNALELHQQSLAIARQIGFNEEEVKSLNGLGNAYSGLKQKQKAIEFYEESLSLARKIDYKQGEGKALTNLGNIYQSSKQYEKAIELYEQSLTIVKILKDNRTEAANLLNLGGIYSLLGQYQKATVSYEQALAIYIKLGNRQGEMDCLIGLGIVYRNLEQYEKAIEFNFKSLAIAKELGDRHNEAVSYGNLGVANKFLGRNEKAIQFHEQALSLYKELAFKEGVGLTLGNLGLAYSSLGEYQKAISLYQESLAIAKELGDKLRQGNALNNIGGIYIKLGQYTNASTRLQEAVDIYETIRLSGLNDANKISIFDTYSRSYRILQQAFILQNKPNNALETAERGRARAFVELLSSRLFPELKQQLSTNLPSIELIKKIAKTQNATLVEYSIVNSEIYIWVIKPTGEVTFRKADLKPLWQKDNTTLDDLVTTSRDSIGARGKAFRGIKVSYNPDAPKATNKLRRLHELLINPIADLLPQNPNDRVIFIPQSSLFLVPFPALQDADGKYLIEKHTILTAPSIQVLDLTHQQRQKLAENRNYASLPTLVLGNPTMPSVPPKPGDKPQKLPALPGAEKEAQAIAPLLNTKAIIGSQGTKTAIVQKMPSARIIHLATHGILDDYRGLGSAIALAPDASFSPKPGEINGLLTAEEILDMKLQAELVVLSACDTGRGKITGDGVIGLSRSLISAGAPSVMVSLWSVPDSPTAEFMSQFYTNLKERRMDKAQALRQAMLTTMKTHPSPRDWAAFTLIGESE
ncbi:MAG: CHAT domain-containing protein [Cyanomargarita calcarea GSE-NOS-MK-12-04C]|uniref:CHAT domain-containing protein n=1 Tax=Cyanomargarita calcarea GSE-NOS-MK-12-04C TaxID=2839659 RepID=A0A951QPF8_9CYAN|nr:CHAT domain-containing protein [Cyanomargarita calcarea GSE-NOS-MK-12-04C]